MKSRVTIKGSNVHEVGYRPFLFSQAFNFGVKKFEAYNEFEEDKQIVICLLDADEDRVKRFSDFVRRNKPKNAEVEEIKQEPYDGDVSEIYTYASALNVEQLSKGVDVLFEIRDYTKMIPEIKEDTSCIRTDISDMKIGISSLIEEKYVKLEREIAEIKEKLAKVKL